LEALLLRRNPQLQVGGGAWVFPGGRVDADDDAGGGGPFLAARNAAFREAAEETRLRIAAVSRQPFAHWTTPLGTPRRFATWFFVTRAPESAEVTVVGSEIVDHRWVAAEEALQAQRAGEITLMPPTFVCLNLLREYRDCAAAIAGFAEREVQHFTPLILKTNKGRVILYKDDAGYASADPNRNGRRHRITMRGNDWHYECG